MLTSRPGGFDGSSEGVDGDAETSSRTPFSRKIHLSVSRVDSSSLVIKVGDTGCGIEKARLEKVFDPFVTYNSLGKGTGLGLSIVHGLVTAMNGRIHVESRVGIGTTIEIVLPILPDENVARGRNPVEQRDGQDKVKRLRILVIDDEEGIRSALQDCLTGHSVTCAQNLSQAYDFLKSESDNVDLILCDMTLGSESGRQFYESLNAQSKKATEKIVLMTGGVNDEPTRLWLETLPNIVLKKPFRLEVLKELVASFSESELKKAL